MRAFFGPYICIWYVLCVILTYQIESCPNDNIVWGVELVLAFCDVFFE